MLSVPDHSAARLAASVRLALGALYSDTTLSQWFDPLRLEVTSRHECVVTMPHTLFAAWLADEYKSALETAVRRTDGSVQTVVYKSPGHVEYQPFQKGVKGGSTSGAAVEQTPFPFGEAYTLDSFINNAKNSFPLAVLKNTTEGNLRYNPLVLYGSTNTGKSHLLKAVGNALASLYGADAVFCGGADDFAVLQAPLQDKDVLHKVTRWRAVILDDVQRIATLPRVRDILPVVLDHCLEAGKPFLCSSDVPPSQWEGLPKRVSSRLEQGLIMLLHEADMDIRLRYVQHQSRAKKLNLNRDQLLSLAQQCTSLRRLSGIMQRLSALRDLLGHDISTQDIERVLAHTADSITVSPRDIIRTVAARLNVREEDIVSGKRHPNVSKARQAAMFLCRSLLGSSYPAIGKVFGGRDHSTVIHSVKKMQQLWETDSDTHNLLTELSLHCRQPFK